MDWWVYEPFLIEEENILSHSLKWLTVIGQLQQIGATFLEIGAGITNSGNHYNSLISGFLQLQLILLQAVVLHLDLTFLASYNNASLICSIFITHKEIHLRFTCSKATYVLKCITPCSSHDNSSLKLTPIFLIHTLFMKLLLIKLALKSPRKKNLSEITTVAVITPPMKKLPYVNCARTWQN